MQDELAGLLAAQLQVFLQQLCARANMGPDLYFLETPNIFVRTRSILASITYCLCYARLLLVTHNPMRAT